MKLEELTVKASCIDNGGNNARIFVTFGSSVKANLSWGYIQFNNPGTSSETSGTTINSSSYAAIDLQGELRTAHGQVIYRNRHRTITVSLRAFMNGGTDVCTVQGTALNAPA